MSATNPIRPYEKVRALIESIGGTMTWHPMGSGGNWAITLHGKTATVSCRDHHVNALDHLYVARVPAPTTWDDYEPDALLVGDAFWRLLELFTA